MPTTWVHRMLAGIKVTRSGGKAMPRNGSAALFELGPEAERELECCW
ncbi:hypothetical protein ACIOK4_43415 [Streptomyces bottropensis]